MGMRGSAAASELEPQPPRSRRRVFRSHELHFLAASVARRAKYFSIRGLPGSRRRVAGAIDGDANRDLDIAAYRLTRRARDVGNFLMEHGGRRGQRRLRILRSGCRRGSRCEKSRSASAVAGAGCCELGWLCSERKPIQMAAAITGSPRRRRRANAPLAAFRAVTARTSRRSTRAGGARTLLRDLDLGFEFTDGGRPARLRLRHRRTMST